MDDEQKDKFNSLLREVGKRVAKEKKQPKEIVDGILIGNVWTAMDKDVMKDIGITAVLVWAENLHHEFESEFKYLTIPILDKSTVHLNFLIFYK